MLRTTLFALSLLLVPTTAFAALDIVGTVNGSDISTATTRENALQVPYSKGFFVQGSVVNTSDETVHFTQVSVKPDIFLFPTLKFPVDSQMGGGQQRSAERTVNFAKLIEEYVPKSLAAWLNNTTVKVNVKAYRDGGVVAADRTMWIHVSDDVEVVPQSAIEAITHSPIAQAGAALAGLSVVGAGAHVFRRRRSISVAGISSVGVAIGTALVLFAIGAIDFFELMSIGAGGGAAGAGIVTFLLQIFGTKGS